MFHKYLLSIIVIGFLSFSLFAQQPQGRLYVHSYADISAGEQQAKLGYIQYPQNQYHFIDSTSADDIISYGDQVYVLQFDLKWYDKNTLQLSDSITNISAEEVELWNDKLLVGCSVTPHFRVYDINNNHQSLFSIDDSKITGNIWDIAVMGDSAFLLMFDRVIIVDMIQQDTVASISLPTGWQFYQAIVATKNGPYLIKELPTALPRFGFDRVNLSTMEIDSLTGFKVTTPIVGKPIVIDSLIYAWNKTTYFNINNDTFHTDFNTMEPVLGYDYTSQTLFTSERITGTNLDRYRYYQNDVAIDSLDTAQAYHIAYWVDESFPNEVQEINQTNEIKLFPNPAIDYAQISSSSPIRTIMVRDITGRTIKDVNVPQASTFHLNTSSWSNGLYFITISTEHDHQTLSLVKSKY